MIEDVKSITEEVRRELQQDSSWGGDVRGALYDLSTNNYTPSIDNQQAINETSKDRGVDSFTQQVPVDQNAGTSASSLAGFYFYFADGTELFIARSTALADYDSTTDTDWSINLPVTDGNVDITITTDDDGNLVSDDITYDDGTLLYGRIDGAGGETDDIDADNPQTFCRIAIIREGKKVSFGGFYREGIRCENGEPIVEFYQI